MRWLSLVIAVGTSLGCATGAPLGAHARLSAAHLRPLGAPAQARRVPEAEPREVASSPLTLRGGRDELVGFARSFVGRRRIEAGGRRFPDDCTGLVLGAFASLGVDLTSEAEPGDNGVTAIYRYARAHGHIAEGGRPAPGDLVFFRDTYDQNRDGRVNDGLTHVGLVEQTLEDGTLVVIHRVHRGVVRYRMNLGRPSTRKDPATGRILNDALRAAGPGRREILTGQLFAAFGSLLPAQPATASR